MELVTGDGALEVNATYLTVEAEKLSMKASEFRLLQKYFVGQFKKFFFFSYQVGRDFGNRM